MRNYHSLKKDYKDRIIRNIRSNKYYKVSYDYYVDLLAGMLAQYHLLEKEMMKDLKFVEVSSSGNKSKSVEYGIMENLRKDIMKSLKDLGLDPQSYEKILNLKKDLKRKEAYIKKNSRSSENSKIDNLISSLEHKYVSERGE